MKKKLVSVIVNCYNGEKYLLQTLKSLLNQKYKNFEVIFMDNCSTDKSASIFKMIKDRRFKYFKTKKKIKLYDSRNQAIKKTKGNFIAFLDVDDWWDDKFLESRKKFFTSSNDYAFSYSNCFHYFENKKKFEIFYKKKLPTGFILGELIDFYFVKLSSIIIKKKLVKNFRFNPSYNIIGDYDFILRIAKIYKGMGFQNKLVNIRIHKDNFTHNNRRMFYTEFKNWFNHQDFRYGIFREKKIKLLQRLNYLRLVYLTLYKKNFGLIFEILKYPLFFLKLKLLVLYFLPKFILRFRQKNL